MPLCCGCITYVGLAPAVFFARQSNYRAHLHSDIISYAFLREAVSIVTTCNCYCFPFYIINATTIKEPR